VIAGLLGRNGRVLLVILGALILQAPVFDRMQVARAHPDLLLLLPVLAGLVAARPGLRVPGQLDGVEVAVQTVLGQQVSLASARTAAGRLVDELGEPLGLEGDHRVTRLFPTAAQIAAVDPASLRMPRSRGRALIGLAAALESGEVRVDRSTDRAETRDALLALPGIGPWTADYVAMRALGDPDVFLPTDIGVRNAASRLGLEGVVARSEAWRPWRSYALMRLWSVVLDEMSPAVSTSSDHERGTG